MTRHRWIVSALILLASTAAAAIPPGISGTRPSNGGGPTEVTVGLFLIDVSRVDGADQSFTADLFILQSWSDPRLAGAFAATEKVPLEDIWSPRLQILNQRQISTTFPDQAEVSPDGTVVTRQRYFGTFSAPLDLHDFPLDRQRFFIRLVVPGYGPDEVTLVPFSVADTGRPIAGMTLEFDGRRHLGFWAGKAFISVAIIVAMSWIVFWLDPKFVAPRLSVSVTSMLTLIAYRFLLDGALPKLSYLTRMDFFLIGATLLVLLTVVQVTVTTAASDRDHGRRAHRINVHSRWVFPAAFALLMLASFWTG
jgi:hypothetical protein